MDHRLVSTTTATIFAAWLAGCMAISPLHPFDKTIPEETSQAGRLLFLAEDIAGRGETQTALALLDRAGELAGDDAMLHTRLGDAYLRLGENERAERAYAMAVDLKPADATALLGLGSAKLRRGETTQAVALIAAAAPQVGTATAYNRLGIAYTLAGRLTEAEAAYRKALALDAADLDIKTNLALATALARRDAEAQALIAEVVAHPTAQQRHHRARVLVLGLTDKAAEVRKTQERRLDPRDVDKLLSQARKIATSGDAKARALALGAVMI
ncbi:tetratricopeptide repeat protein [Chelatococcus composti]|jgi:Flp pilus assembly protein TadD|uniref:Flp pilus assembly protein TadD n=1 Tax=Chelatococcus composti TaxID=1743235 RepID=A0A841K4M4_9HYPH|nr:tetratricopeptide repeat protein [Chelatococcus composti]MBB6167255.1 Flp pilus assembly protein TadD [Chelatococcus composti]MBS7735464.1 tetratricopeptide repeat protein [Chelatococcus composti]GGG30532.1 pilus assembly protein TadD [Chelatococcus composti]